MVLRERSYDYKFRYCGHCNTTTDIKEANFFGRYAGLQDRSEQQQGDLFCAGSPMLLFTE